MVADTGLGATTVNEHAHQLLRDHGVTVLKIIRVETDSILFLGASQRPMTAWISANSGLAGALVCTEPGWPIEQTDRAYNRKRVRTQEDSKET